LNNDKGVVKFFPPASWFGAYAGTEPGKPIDRRFHILLYENEAERQAIQRPNLESGLATCETEKTFRLEGLLTSKCGDKKSQPANFKGRGADPFQVHKELGF